MDANFSSLTMFRFGESQRDHRPQGAFLFELGTQIGNHTLLPCQSRVHSRKHSS